MTSKQNERGGDLSSIQCFPLQDGKLLNNMERNNGVFLWVFTLLVLTLSGRYAQATEARK